MQIKPEKISLHYIDCILPSHAPILYRCHVIVISKKVKDVLNDNPQPITVKIYKEARSCLLKRDEVKWHRRRGFDEQKSKVTSVTSNLSPPFWSSTCHTLIRTSLACKDSSLNV